MNSNSISQSERSRTKKSGTTGSKKVSKSKPKQETTLSKIDTLKKVKPKQSQKNINKAKKESAIESSAEISRVISEDSSIPSKRQKSNHSAGKTLSSHSKERKRKTRHPLSDRSDKSSKSVSVSSSKRSIQLPTKTERLEQKLRHQDKDQLQREYRILYYRNREVRQLLKEYFQANSELVEQAEETKTLLQDLQKRNKEYKYSLKDNKQRLREQDEIIDNLNQEIKYMRQNYEKEIDTLTFKLSEAERNKYSTYKQHEIVQQRQNGHEQEMQSMQMDLRAKEKLIENLERQMIELENRHYNSMSTRPILSQISPTVPTVQHQQQDNQEEIKQLKKQLEEHSQVVLSQQKEIDEMNKTVENYKNKYLSMKYENRKLKAQMEQKENTLIKTYSTELEKVKHEKVELETKRKMEDQQRNFKDKKLKVISEIQSLIKQHKRQID